MEVWKILSRHVGAHPGIELSPVPADGKAGPPALVSPGQSGERYLILDAGSKGDRSPHRTFLRLRDATAAPLQDWLDRRVAEPVADPVVLPPLFYCKHKNDWVTAIPIDGDATPKRRSKMVGLEEAAESVGPLEMLWQGVQASLGRERPKKASASKNALPEPLCYGCERKRSCYPATGSPTRPKEASAALVPVAGSPWCGALVEPLDVPLAGWLCLLEGGKVADAVEADRLPEVQARVIEQRLRDRPRLLVPRDFPKRALGEALMLRLEILRQLLQDVRHARIDLDRPARLQPEGLWVNLGETNELTPTLWGPRLRRLDLETPAGDDGLAAELIPTQRGPKLAIPGMLIQRGDSDDEEGAKGVKFLFLPESECATLPESDVSVTVALVREGRDEQRLEARIEVAFSDVFRLVIFPGQLAPDELADIFAAADQTFLRVGESEPQADADLFVTGTIWLGMLRHDCADLAGAAGLRDALAKALASEEIQRRDDEAAERACLTTALKVGGLFAGAIPDRDDRTTATSELRLLGRSLWLGLRMCLPLDLDAPADSKPVISAMLDGYLAEIEVLRNEGRYLMLGRTSPEEEIISVVRAFELDRVPS